MRMDEEDRFVSEEKERAAALRREWHIGCESQTVDDWMDVYVQVWRDRQGAYDRGLSLLHQLQTAYSAEIVGAGRLAMQYLLARLLFYSNWEGHFGESVAPVVTAYTQSLIKNLSGRVRFMAADFLFLIHGYLAPEQVSSRNDIAARLISVAESSRLLSAGNARRGETIGSLLGVIARKSYHTDLKGFRRVLDAVQPEDAEIIAALKTFHSVHGQGCFGMLRHLFNFRLDADERTDFEAKRYLIEVFDMARGVRISSLWRERVLVLATLVDADRLGEWCRIVRREEDWLYDKDTGLKDDIVVRFRKAALWTTMILGEE